MITLPRIGLKFTTRPTANSQQAYMTAPALKTCISWPIHSCSTLCAGACLTDGIRTESAIALVMSVLPRRLCMDAVLILASSTASALPCAESMLEHFFVLTATGGNGLQREH